MKQLFANARGPAWILALAVFSFSSNPSEAAPGLSADLSNGLPRLKISGPVGAGLSIQYVTSLPATNQWIELTNFSLPASPYEWIDTSALPTPQRFYRVGTQVAAPANMAPVPAGQFAMGDAFSMGSTAELPVHTVFVSGFYIDRYEVTKAQWDEVYQWATNHGYTFSNPGVGKGTNHPVHSISWYDALKWCNARSEQEGLAPAYYTDEEQTQPYRTGQLIPEVKWKAGYRLPTEAEWEKAARGGAAGHRFPWTDTDTINHSMANYFAAFFVYDTQPEPKWYHASYNDGMEPYTSPGGAFTPNGYGLYDMSGNVLEWCWDLFLGYYYSQSPDSDPLGPSSTWENSRVVRGGAWGYDCADARVSARNSAWMHQAANETGFRTVLPQ